MNNDRSHLRNRTTRTHSTGSQRRRSGSTGTDTSMNNLSLTGEDTQPGSSYTCFSGGTAPQQDNPYRDDASGIHASNVGLSDSRTIPRRRKPDYSWLKYLLAALACLLLLLLLGSSLGRLMGSNRSHPLDFKALKKHGHITVNEFDEKLLFITPYLPDSYEDPSEASIVITNLDKPENTYAPSAIPTGNRNVICYVLERGVYSVDLTWPNGVTANAILHVGDQSLYQLAFTHI